MKELREKKKSEGIVSSIYNVKEMMAEELLSSAIFFY